MTANYEQKDTLGAKLFWGSVAMLVLTGIGLLVALGLFGFFDETKTARERPHPMTEFREGPRGPVLLAEPSDELKAHRAQERRLLQSHGWVDPDKEIVRIPIERAMELTLRELGK
jgi:hypothetical protein